MKISRRIGKFAWDRRVVLLLMLAGLLVTGRTWLNLHPEHDPWAPLDLRHPPGWATQAKLRAIQGDVALCRQVLERSGIDHAVLDPAGEGACLREDRTRLADYPLSPDTPPTTCDTAVSLYLWERDVVRPAARAILDSELARIEHLGAYSCRRLYGRDEGPWSEHATGNAIDIAGFTLADGTSISVLGDWSGQGAKARFLREVRDGACENFSTVLSPDYNAAHRDHFHLDMTTRWGSVCR